MNLKFTSVDLQIGITIIVFCFFFIRSFSFSKRSLRRLEDNSGWDGRLGNKTWEKLSFPLPLFKIWRCRRGVDIQRLFKEDYSRCRLHLYIPGFFTLTTKYSSSVLQQTKGCFWKFGLPSWWWWSNFFFLSGISSYLPEPTFVIEPD